MYRVAGAPEPPVDCVIDPADCPIPSDNLTAGAKLLRMWSATHK